MSLNVGTIPDFRADKLSLRSPRILDDGTKVYWATLAEANKPLRYAWGEETPTREALSDPEYLDSLRGLSIVAGHPDEPVRNGAPKSGKGAWLGTLINSKYDFEEDVVLVELSVPTPENQEVVERDGALSEGYTPTIHTDENGVRWQVKRRSNHVASTGTPRYDKSRIQLDSEGEELEEVMSAIKALSDQVSALMAKMSPSEDEKPEDKPELGDAVAVELGDKARTDAVSFKEGLQARIEREVSERTALLEKARDLGVRVDGKSAVELRKNLALAIGGDQTRCDSVEYCEGFIANAKVKVNTDSVTSPKYAI